MLIREYLYENLSACIIAGWGPKHFTSIDDISRDSKFDLKEVKDAFFLIVDNFQFNIDAYFFSIASAFSDLTWGEFLEKELQDITEGKGAKK